MTQLDGPFKRLGSDQTPDPLGFSRGDELVCDWLLRLASPNSKLSIKLRGYGFTQEVQINQKGRRFRAIGLELPALHAYVNDELGAIQSRPMDQVTFSIGISLHKSPDYRIKDVPPKDGGLYIGVRAQKRSPEGTLPQHLHDAIYAQSVSLLSETRLKHWEPRPSPDYWSIWAWAGRNPERLSPANFEEQVIDEYIEGFASLRGLFWQQI